MNKSYLIAFADDGQPYIAHYGVQGMKWGIRRYQNPDGTLTDAGVKRYGKHGAEYLHAKQVKKEANKAYSKAFDAAYDKSYQAYSLSKKRRKANDERWNKAFDAAEKARNADKNFKDAKKKMRDETGRSHESKLKAQNYQKYSKDNLPIISIGKHYIMNAKYWKDTMKDIKAMDHGKAKAYVNAFLDQPMHISGITGTSDTTFRKRISGKFTELY